MSSSGLKPPMPGLPNFGGGGSQWGKSVLPPSPNHIPGSGIGGMNLQPPDGGNYNPLPQGNMGGGAIANGWGAGGQGTGGAQGDPLQAALMQHTGIAPGGSMAQTMPSMGTPQPAQPNALPSMPMGGNAGLAPAHVFGTPNQLSDTYMHGPRFGNQ